MTPTLTTALEQTRTNKAEPPAEARPLPVLVCSSAGESEPSTVPVHGADQAEGINGSSLRRSSGLTALASMSTGKLRSVVAGARGSHGPRRSSWSSRERAAWHELVVVRGQAA